MLGKVSTFPPYKKCIASSYDGDVPGLGRTSSKNTGQKMSLEKGTSEC